MNKKNIINKHKENHAIYFKGLVAALSTTTQPITEDELLNLLDEFGLPYAWLLAKLTDTSTNVAHLVGSFLAKETAGVRGVCLTLAQRKYKGEDAFQNVQLFDRFNMVAKDFKSFADLDEDKLKELFYIISNVGINFSKEAFEHAVEWMLFRDGSEFYSDAIEFKQAYFQVKEITKEAQPKEKKQENILIYLQGVSLVCPGCGTYHNRKLQVLSIVIHDLESNTHMLGKIPTSAIVLELDKEGKVVVGKRDYQLFKDLIGAVLEKEIDNVTANVVIQEVVIKQNEA